MGIKSIIINKLPERHNEKTAVTHVSDTSLLKNDQRHMKNDPKPKNVSVSHNVSDTSRHMTHKPDLGTIGTIEHVKAVIHLECDDGRTRQVLMSLPISNGLTQRLNLDDLAQEIQVWSTYVYPSEAEAKLELCKRLGIL